MALTNLTGVAARSVGYVIGAILLVLALFPKLPAVLLTIPSPVMGASLLIAVGLLFVEGIRTVVRDGLDYQKVVVVGVAFSLGAGLQHQTIIADLLGGIWGELLNNGMLIGALAVVLMTLFLSLTNPRKSQRLQVTLDASSLPEIDRFVREIAFRIGWNEASTERLCFAAEEALMSLIQAGEDQPTDEASCLIIVARPDVGLMEIEFIAVFDKENLEDRLTYLDDEIETPEEDKISLRLLQHYASSVRHRKYYGLDIVTVQVKGSQLLSTAQRRSSLRILRSIARSIQNWPFIR